MSTITCPECKLVNWATQSVCKRCAFVFEPLAAPAPPPVATEVDAAYGEPVTADTFVETAQFAPQDPPLTYPSSTDTSQAPPRTYPSSTDTSQAPPRTYTPRAEPVYREYSSQQAKPKIALAVFSMVAGIVGMPPLSTFIMVIVGGILSVAFGAAGFITGVVLVCLVMPVGLISGIVALRRANRSTEYGGKGFALTGIISSSLACVVLPIVAAIAIPNLIASRKAANEGNAVSTMRTLASAEEIFMKDLGSGHCGDFDVLEGVSLIEKTPVRGEKSGYRYLILTHPKGGCEIHATPISSSTGNRAFFYSTDDGTIRATVVKGRQAGKDDPPIKDGYSKNDDLPAKIALQKSR